MNFRNGKVYIGMVRSAFLVSTLDSTYLCSGKELVPHKNHICCHNYCHGSLSFSKMAAEKLCTEQNPKMWELAQEPHCPFCHPIKETKSTGSWLNSDCQK